MKNRMNAPPDLALIWGKLTDQFRPFTLIADWQALPERGYDDATAISGKQVKDGSRSGGNVIQQLLVLLISLLFLPHQQVLPGVSLAEVNQHGDFTVSQVGDTNFIDRKLVVANGPGGSF
jgi:hypothetical protein